MPHHRFLAALSLALLLLAAQNAGAAPATKDFILPADDGYGMDDCLAEAGTCGQLVADA